MMRIGFEGWSSQVVLAMVVVGCNSDRREGADEDAGVASLATEGLDDAGSNTVGEDDGTVGSGGGTAGPSMNTSGTTGGLSGPSSSGETTDGDGESTTGSDGESTTGSPVEPECGALVATIRDFRANHPDFEVYSGNQAYTGLVLENLGADDTPQYNPDYSGEPMITSAETFAQWYHDVPDINVASSVELALAPQGDGTFVFDSAAFFPVDDAGFGNEGNDHNFHFTTEVHTTFTYEGGEVFTFRGDDDVWMFIDGKLALDLGGLHPALSDTVEMDALGLEVGQTYAMDIFHAERHTNESNFRIVTTIDCFVPVPQ